MSVDVPDVNTMFVQLKSNENHTQYPCSENYKKSPPPPSIKKCSKQFGQAQNLPPSIQAMSKFKQFFYCLGGGGGGGESGLIEGGIILIFL